MNIDNRKTEERIFKAALKLKTPAERKVYLESACANNPGLLERVMTLLAVHDSQDSILDKLITDVETDPGSSLLSEGPGTTIGRYKLLEKIGEGGMAVVYMAEQERPIRRKVALKIIKLGMDTQQVIARFEVERQVLAILDHPNIAKVLDAGATDSGRPYFVMELVTGISITEYCDTHKLNTHERLDLFVQVCQAIQHAHQKGIIHRDIKPSNVMVTLHDGKPVPKVIDFGIAKATDRRLTEKTLFTRYAQMIGTPAYMSPEQVEMSSLEVDTRSDIYSLGILLYELLTGVTPFCPDTLRSAGYQEMQRIICEEEPTLPSTRLTLLGDKLATVAQQRKISPDSLRKRIRGDLDWIVMKSLAKDRARRYATASDVVADIMRHINNEAVLAGPPSRWYQIKKFAQRHRATVTLSVVILLGFIVSMVMFLRAEQARRAESRAHTEAQTVLHFLTDHLLASVHPERAKGQEVTVRYILESAAQDLESQFKNRPMIESNIRQTLGLIYQKMGDYPAAEQHLQRTYALRSKHLGDHDPLTLAAIHDLGWLRCRQGQYAESEQLLLKAWEGRNQFLGHEHPDTLASLTSLGTQYMMQARFAEGMDLSQKVFDTARRVLGPEHLVTLQSNASVSLGYLARREIDQAQSLLSEGLPISQRTLGEEHETTLILMNLQVWVYSIQRQYDKAMDLARNALEGCKKILGPDHPTTMIATSNLGYLYCQQGLYDRAAPHLIHSVKHSQSILGDLHGYRTLFLLRLSFLYQKQGQSRQEEKVLVESFRISHLVHGKDHPQTGYIRYFLKMLQETLTREGTDHFQQRDYDLSLETFKRADRIHQLIFETANPTHLGHIAMSLFQLDRIPKGHQVLNQLRGIYQVGTLTYDETPLYKTELMFAADGSPAKAAWDLILAGELEDALSRATEILGSAETSNSDLLANVQSLVQALVRAYCWRGQAAELENNYNQAQNDYQIAAHIVSDGTLPLYQLACLQACCPIDELRDGTKAIAIATKLCALSDWKEVRHINALAAGYAEQGDFATAIQWQQKAIAQLPETVEPAILSSYEKRLNGYQSGNSLHMQQRDALVLWWTFDGSTNAPIADASGNGHHGQLIDKAKIITNAQRGNVVDLTGSGSIQCQMDPARDLKDALTVMVWVQVDSLKHSQRTLVSTGSSCLRLRCINEKNDWFLLSWELEIPNREPQVLVRMKNFSRDTWHHIAAVFDGSNMFLYVNGELVVTKEHVEAMNIHVPSVSVGTYSSPPGNPWRGVIDDVRIYRDALSATEIMAVYQGPRFSLHQPFPHLNN